MMQTSALTVSGMTGGNPLILASLTLGPYMAIFIPNMLSLAHTANSHESHAEFIPMFRRVLILQARYLADSYSAIVYTRIRKHIEFCSSVQDVPCLGWETQAQTRNAEHKLWWCRHRTVPFHYSAVTGKNRPDAYIMITRSIVVQNHPLYTPGLGVY